MGDFFKFLLPSKNIWTLNGCALFMLLILQLKQTIVHPRSEIDSWYATSILAVFLFNSFFNLGAQTEDLCFSHHVFWSYWQMCWLRLLVFPWNTIFQFFLQISKSQQFFPIWIPIVLINLVWEPSRNKLKSILLPKIVLTFHSLNKLFKWSQRFYQNLAFSLEFQKFFSIIRTFFLTVGQNNFGSKMPFPTTLSFVRVLYTADWLHSAAVITF